MCIHLLKYASYSKLSFGSRLQLSPAPATLRIPLSEFPENSFLRSICLQYSKYSLPCQLFTWACSLILLPILRVASCYRCTAIRSMESHSILSSIRGWFRQYNEESYLLREAFSCVESPLISWRVCFIHTAYALPVILPVSLWAT